MPASPLSPAKPPVSQEKLDQVARELRALIAKAAAPSAEINTWTHQGPLDSWVVAAAVKDGAPGSPVARVLIDKNGVTYGVHGEKDFADLVRSRGWLQSAPDADALMKLYDIAAFEGVSILIEKPPPTVAVAKGELTLTFYRKWHPSGGETRVDVKVGASGKAAVESK
jgi:hypothetical protein